MAQVSRKEAGIDAQLINLFVGNITVINYLIKAKQKRTRHFSAIKIPPLYYKRYRPNDRSTERPNDQTELRLN